MSIPRPSIDLSRVSCIEFFSFSFIESRAPSSDELGYALKALGAGTETDVALVSNAVVIDWVLNASGYRSGAF